MLGAGLIGSVAGEAIASDAALAGTLAGGNWLHYRRPRSARAW